MKEEHNGHLIAPSCTASPATALSFTQDQSVDGERAPVKAPGKNGTASPEAAGHWSGNRRQTIIAIDPGVSGGVAFQRDGQAVECVAMPGTEGDLVSLLCELADNPSNTVAILEEVGGYAGTAQPGSRMFTFGRNFGFILGVLSTLRIRIELVRPAKWQKALSLGTAKTCASRTQWKNKLKGSAQRLFPNVRTTLQTADALLILEYARKSRGS